MKRKKIYERCSSINIIMFKVLVLITLQNTAFESALQCLSNLIMISKLDFIGKLDFGTDIAVDPF